MGKRKRAEKAVARVTRDISIPLQLDCTVSVHTTAAGRLAQTTSFLPSTFDLIEGHEHRGSLEFHTHLESNDSASGGFEIDGDASAWSEGQSERITEDADDANESEPEDSPLFEWVKYHRAAYLDEMMRHEGRAGFEGCTRNCGREGLYHCKDCFGCRQWCRICFVEQHAHAPLHRALVSQPRYLFLDPD
jgi:hypothetical protein